MALRCEYVDSNGCVYRYYVGVNEETLDFTDVHVEFRRCEFLSLTLCARTERGVRERRLLVMVSSAKL